MIQDDGDDDDDDGDDNAYSTHTRNAPQFGAYVRPRVRKKQASAAELLTLFVNTPALASRG